MPSPFLSSWPSWPLSYPQNGCFVYIPLSFPVNRTPQPISETPLRVCKRRAAVKPLFPTSDEACLRRQGSSLRLIALRLLNPLPQSEAFYNGGFHKHHYQNHCCCFLKRVILFCFVSFLIMYVCGRMRTQKDQKKELSFLELESQTIVSCLTWVLGTEFRSSTRIISSLKS